MRGDRSPPIYSDVPSIHQAHLGRARSCPISSCTPSIDASITPPYLSRRLYSCNGSKLVFPPLVVRRVTDCSSLHSSSQITFELKEFEGMVRISPTAFYKAPARSPTTTTTSISRDAQPTRLLSTLNEGNVVTGAPPCSSTPTSTVASYEHAPQSIDRLVSSTSVRKGR